jgi:isopentenyl-diphosphate Delta-isomerase
METQVILVDKNDRELGVASKSEAHKKGLLHRAFSIFIFNNKGEMLLQQRVFNKYHSGGLWTNACCSHPQPNEKTPDAANRRLSEELGIQTNLKRLFGFIYKTEFENGLTEYEYDHVFVGEFEGEISIDKTEIADFCYQSMPEMKISIDNFPAKYTTWFRLAFPKIFEWWQGKYQEPRNEEPNKSKI